MKCNLRAILIAITVILTRGAAAQEIFPPVPTPSGNPITTDKALLGKVLFWDEQLSSTRMTACGTCHIPAAGMSDPRGAVHPGPDEEFGTPDDKNAASRGPVGSDASGRHAPARFFGLRPQVGTRRALPTINTAYFSSFFWDGRIEDPEFRDPLTGDLVLSEGASLENQVAQPPVNDFEMAHFGRKWPDVIARVENATPLAASPSVTPDLAAFISGRSYPGLFKKAFGDNGVSAARIVMAIATYLRTLISDQSRFDRVSAGEDVFSPSEALGYDLFNANGCVECHAAPFFGGVARPGFTFVNTGVRPPAEDRGRGTVVGDPAFDGAFRVPSLRNVALRAPFFHDGSHATLEEVVEFYDRGAEFPIQAGFDHLIRPLGLEEEERAAIVAFLYTLTDDRVAAEEAPFDRPALASGSRAPVLVGTPTPGTDGLAPRMVAFDPPFAGNPGFTLGLDRTPYLVQAYLVSSLGSVSGGLKIGPLALFVDPVGAHVTPSELTRFDEENGSGGFSSLTFAIPPSAAGAVSFHQWVVVDPGATKFVAASRAARVEVY